MSKAKITILFSSLSGELVGGGQQSLLLYFRGIDRARFIPVLVCPGKGQLVETARSLRIHTAVIPMPKIARLKLSSIVGLRKLIREQNIDCVHTDSPRQTVYCGIAALLCGKPLIWHVRTSMGENPLFERFLYAISSKVIAVSKTAAERFPWDRTRKYKKVDIVYNGVDIMDFDKQVRLTDIRKVFGIEPGSLVVGTAGQILPTKGQEIFIRAASIVHRKCGGAVTFLIAGTGEEKYVTSLVELSRTLGIGDKTVFTGFRNDMASVMNAVDIFVLATSLKEGLSRVIIEAMAAAKPVVATDIGGNCEAVDIGASGMLFPVGNVNSLAEAVFRLASDKELCNTMGRAGRKKLERQFDIGENIKAVQDIYEELVCQNP